MNIKSFVEDLILPEYKTDTCGGFDIYLQQDVELTVGVNNVIPLGFATELPPNTVALLLPRSSIGIKGIGLRNTVGVIDSDYRGEWVANVTIDEQGDNAYGDKLNYKRGDRLFQCIILPFFRDTFSLVTDLSSTTRNSGNFGSTGL